MEAAPRFAFEPTRLDVARAVLAWRYGGPYAGYSADPARREAGAREWAGFRVTHRFGSAAAPGGGAGAWVQLERPAAPDP